MAFCRSRERRRTVGRRRVVGRPRPENLVAGSVMMKIGLLCCWSNMRIYPIYSSSLKKALETLTGSEVPVITTDCMCFDKGNPVDEDYDYINIPYHAYMHPTALDRSRVAPRLTMYAKTEGYSLLEYLRGRAFARRADEFDVVDFQQSSYAFGYESLKAFLSRRVKAKRIVTIHKLDQVQKEQPELNRVYDKADGVIVFSQYLKDALVADGVREDKIAVVYHGTALPELRDTQRDQAILFCGSPIPNVKGFEYYVVALRLLREQGIDVNTRIYGFFRKNEKEYALRVAADQGVDGSLEWQSFTNEGELIDEYQKSLVNVIPYTGYAGYFPAACALGNAVPIVATDVLGHGEYVGDAGLLVPPASAEQLADAMARVLQDDALRRQLGANGRARAERTLGWDAVAEQTYEVFENVLHAP
jgi:glycosyltransferase involved in cell wall biosynthesis